MAKSVGLGVIEFVNEFQRLRPDVILLIGDRYEALSAAIAAAYMNITVAHVQGGEVSGSIDESARHAITKFAHLHFPSTRRSAEYIVRMGEEPERVHFVGCPAGDYIRGLDTDLPRGLLSRVGVGASFELDDPFLLVIYHPVTTEYGFERRRVEELIAALDKIGHSVLWIWPNIDAGSDDISKAIRVYREHHKDTWLHLIKGLEPVLFQKCLKKTACAIGNSSSMIRDSTFSGTPVVLLGNRQQGREVGPNLITAELKKESIIEAIRSQVAHGPYPPSDLYGSGEAAERITSVLCGPLPKIQKRLSYVEQRER
jgi:UDP-hydrolysing UDP-N-acetyl-D-glucosamine 2-epimerase